MNFITIKINYTFLTIVSRSNDKLYEKGNFANTRDYWNFGLCPLSGILKTTKDDVLEAGSVSILR
jgi:hypothetical protein